MNLFNDQLDYALAHYFLESEIIKDKLNKLISHPLMTHFTKKLSYKNADEWMEKLSEITWGILENKWIEHKFNVESGISGIAGQKIIIQLQNMLSCI